MRGDRLWRGALLSQVGADPAVAAAIAQGNDLLPELPGVGAALVPAFVQVGLLLVEDGGPVVLPLASEEVFWLRSVGEAVDGAVGHLELTPDGTAAVAGFQQRVDRGVPGSDAVGEPLAPPWRVRLLLGWRRFIGLPLGIGDQDAKALAVAGDSPLSGLPEVVPQMPAVGDLRRLGCPCCGAFREERCAPGRRSRCRVAPPAMRPGWTPSGQAADPPADESRRRRAPCRRPALCVWRTHQHQPPAGPGHLVRAMHRAAATPRCG